MEHPLTIVCTPLPAGPVAELEGWRHAFEAALEPWLDARQLAHVRRFGRPAPGQQAAQVMAQGMAPDMAQVTSQITSQITGQVTATASEAQQASMQEVQQAGLSRLFARAQLLVAAARQAPLASASTLPQMGMDTRGRPVFDGWHAAFSHSESAAFCALCPAAATAAAASHAIDAEALTSAPPHASAFSRTELHAPHGLPQEFIAREALRRWTIKEALLKASGVGLGINPASVPTGHFGQRAGFWRGPLGTFHWRTIPCPGHWLCLARQVDAKNDWPQTSLTVPSPAVPSLTTTRPYILLIGPHALLHSLAALRLRG